MFGSRDSVSGSHTERDRECGIDRSRSPVVLGEIQSILGTASLQRADGSHCDPRAGEPVLQGDVIETFANSTLTIIFEDGTVFELSPLTRFVLAGLEGGAGAQKDAPLLSVARGGFAFSKAH